MKGGTVMYVYVLETFDREDEYCEYNSEVVAVYAEENFKDAKEHWKRLCESRTDEDDETETWRRNGGYFFSSKYGSCESYRFSFVGLKKMKVQ